MSRELRVAFSSDGCVVDFDALKTKMESTATRVLDLYEALVDAPTCSQPLANEIFVP